MANLEWGKAACSDEPIEKWTGADVFRPGELLEWRAPTKDETPEQSTLEDGFVILSLNHIMCGLRMDPSDFFVRVLEHYGIEWCHLTPNSITVLSIFAHLCEAYLGVPPTVEVFAHFYRLYPNKKGETDTLGGVYFRLRGKMKRNYPVYYLKASQFMWTCLWFYAKLPRSCRLVFQGNVLKKSNNWKEVLPLSPEQAKQVRQIKELSSQGLTGVNIVCDYLNYQISPLRRRAHLACNYNGPADPTRDSDTDLSEEDIESKLSYLLDLKKTGQKEPPRGHTAPTSLIRASADKKDLLDVLSTLKAKKHTVEEWTGPRSIRKSSADKPLVPASPRRYTNIEDEETLEVREAITTAASPNQGMEQESVENPDEIEEGKRAALMKPISSIIGGKRKFFSPSGSRRKVKYSFISVMTNTRTSSLDNGRIKGTSLRKEAATALNPQSPVSNQNKSALFILTNVANQNKVPEDPVPNLPLHQHVRDSPPNEFDPAQSIAERVQLQEATEESAPIQGPNTEEIDSEAIWGEMLKVNREYESLSQTTLTKLLEQAKKLVIENQRMKNEHKMLEQQQVKDLEENKRFLIDMTRKAEAEASKRIEEHTELKNEITDQKNMIDELSMRIMLTQESFVQKCTEVNCLEKKVAVLSKDKEEVEKKVAVLSKDKEDVEKKVAVLSKDKEELGKKVAMLLKDKEELQSRVLLASEAAKQISALFHGEGEGNRES